MFPIHRQHRHCKNFVWSAGAVLVLAVFVAACGKEEAKSPQAKTSVQDDTAKLHDTMTFKIAGNPNPAERIQFPDFSIVAPQGERWIERRLPEPPSNYGGFLPRIMFVKVVQQTTDAPHSVIAQVSTLQILSAADKVSIITNPREYMKFMMDYEVQINKLTTDRLRVKSIEAKMDETLGICYRLDIEVEDRGVYGFPNTAFILDVHQYECANPDGRLIAKIEYSQRRPPEANAVDLSREGEDFLKSFKFAEPQG